MRKGHEKGVRHAAATCSPQREPPPRDVLRRPACRPRRVLDDGTANQIDFLWRKQRLSVETDGWASHGTRQAFENDRRRDRLLRLAGYGVVRFTWRDVVHEPHEVEATLRALLAKRLR